MNAHTTQDIVIIPRESALKVYTEPGAIHPYLDQIKVEVDAFAALGLTVATKKDREAIRSMAFRLARTRTALENVGKLLADEVKAIPKKVDATRRLVRERIEAWEEEVRGPLTEWEEAEKARVAGHEAALDEVERWSVFPGEWTADQIRAHINACKAHPHQTRDWQEFAETARDFLAGSMNALDRLLARAVKDEENAAELARLRAESEARAAAERAAEEKRQAEERERRIAEEAAAAERERSARAQALAEARAREAEEAAERAKREKAEAEERAEQERVAAAERARLAAEKAERDRVAAAEEAAEAERRRAAEQKAREDRAAAAREADKKHRAKINNEAKDALIAAGLSEAAAVAAVTAIAKGDVPNVRISY